MQGIRSEPCVVRDTRWDKRLFCSVHIACNHDYVKYGQHIAVRELGVLREL